MRNVKKDCLFWKIICYVIDVKLVGLYSHRTNILR